MPSVFRRLYSHIVWATKNREPRLVEALQPHLYEAIRDKCRRLGCALHGVNALQEHVHLALEIPPSHAVAFVVGQLKGSSSHAVNQIQPGSLQWQEGYGAVTFRKSELGKVLEYIATQKERHRVGALSPMLEACEDSEADAENERASDA